MTAVTMGRFQRFADGLTNVFSGLGGKGDPRTGNAYAFAPLTQYQIIAAYRGSGLMRKIIEIPADDVVREWREWKGDADQIATIWKEEQRLSIPQKLREAEVLRGLGGGAFILGAPGDPATPLPKVGKGGLAYVHVVSRWQLSALGWIDDPTDPLFGEPSMWRINTQKGQVSIHPSRVIAFRGDFMPDIASANLEDRFWGESRVARVLSAVEDCDTARQSFAALITKASRLRLGIPGLAQLIAEGQDSRIQGRLANLMMGESIMNATIYDRGDAMDGAGNSGEQIDDVQYNFAGIKDVMESFSMWVSAIADIPATRLLGRAPEGMNASGNSQQIDWNKVIRARQTMATAPCLNRLDAALVPSALGSTPEGLTYEFPPLDLPSEKEVAETFKLNIEAIEKLQATATVPDVALSKAVQSLLTEQGWLPGMEQALAEVPESERYGIEQPDGADDPNNGDLTGQQGQANSDPQAKEGGDPTADARGVLPTLPASPFADATPRPLYVKRRLLNAADLVEWAKANGFTETVPADDMHVTILYSRSPVDPMKMGETWGGEEDGGLIIRAGGPRALERFDGGAVVLQFASWALQNRHADMVRAGGSHDYGEYLPHVTLTYGAPADLDIAAIKPFTGELRFGPEEFEPLDLDWKSKIEEI